MHRKEIWSVAVAEEPLVVGSWNEAAAGGRGLATGLADAGAKLVTALDEAGMNIKSAFWLYLPETDSWRLVIATPDKQRLGVKKLYERVDRTLERESLTLEPIRLDDISIVDPTYHVVKLLRGAVRTGAKDVSNLRFSRNVIDGEFIEDSLIYRST